MSEREQKSAPAVVALAGRRIDASGAHPPRFPLGQVPEVSRRVADALHKAGAAALVCSAACGADLVALGEAERLGLRRRIVLPFAVQLFREKSVIDRPGDWGPIFDRQIAAAQSAGDLIVLEYAGDDDDAYAQANQVIVREALALARGAKGAGSGRLVAMLVWEGTARAGKDATAGFAELAKEAGFERESIPTL